MSKLCWHSSNVSNLPTYQCNLVLVAIRSQQQWPDDPQGHMMDYFGNYRSPDWDVMDKIEEENEQINEELPDLRDQIDKLQAELATSKRKTRIVQIYRSADPDAAVSEKTFYNCFAEFRLYEDGRSKIKRFRKIRGRSQTDMRAICDHVNGLHLQDRRRDGVGAGI